MIIIFNCTLSENKYKQQGVYEYHTKEVESFVLFFRMVRIIIKNQASSIRKRTMTLGSQLSQL